MKKVYICSQCRGDYENNIQRAKEYSRAAVEKGVIPVTPHIYLTQFMDDNVPEERELALKIGSELVLGCSELWAFGIDHPSAGMAAEIELAKAFLAFINSPEEIEAYLLAEGGSAPLITYSDGFLEEQAKVQTLGDLSADTTADTVFVPCILDMIPASVANSDFGRELPQLANGTYTPEQFAQVLTDAAAEASLE